MRFTAGDLFSPPSEASRESKYSFFSFSFSIQAGQQADEKQRGKTGAMRDIK